jgi:hypothetical protein
MAIFASVEKAKRFLFARRYSYRQIFSGPPGEAVLRDLAVFCRAGESTFHDNERVQSKLDGRREVFLRISAHLNLTEAQLWELYDGRAEYHST